MFIFGSTNAIFSLSWWGFILGGVGIFLLGITFLGEGLRKMAGQKLKGLIDKFTSTPIKGVLVGTLVTVLIQSSGATTAMAIGFIKAGLMSLPQAIGVIMGANIGTTVTAFIIGLNVSQYAPFILAIGAFMFLFGRKQFSRHLGETLFGFGALFFGLELLESSLSSLADLPGFIKLIQSLEENPILGVLIGTVATAAIQSSSAFIGILQGFVSSDSGFTMLAALPILFGSNIGSTITAILASFGSSTSAKRASAVHIIFNVLGTVLFMLLLRPYASAITWISDLLHVDPKMQIALAHIAFNLLTTLMLLPCVNILVKITTKLIPDNGKEINITIDLHELERDVVSLAPTTALDIAKRQIVNMGKLAIDAITAVINYINSGETSDHDMVLSLENSVDHVYEKITDFLSSMRKTVLEEKDVTIYSQSIQVMKDIERVSDHCENLVEYFEEASSRGEKINAEAKDDLVQMLEFAKQMVSNAVVAFETNDGQLACVVINQDDELDEMHKNDRIKHIERFRDGSAEQSRFIALVFVDIIANIERMGDHAVNIANSILHININE